MKNIWSIAFSPSTATANQRASWFPATTPAAASSCKHADDQGDPSPGAQVPEHVMGVSEEHVRVGDRGNAVDQAGAADDHQQDGREQDQAVASATVTARAAR